ASIQLATCTPNCLIQESSMTWGGFHSEVVKTPIRWEDGYITPSTEPGLGIELDMDVVRRHTPYTGERLHLQMGE
ncbi:mandelate racemase/muconate lactonizing enzyme family protein, partial [Escherichia coli]|nr:mandelate racemase/muconate lactonizing enzyme family protein [Escherichia coli]